MTNMEWIEQIAKEGGVHYGKTVNRNPEKYRFAKIESIQDKRTCEKCGNLFAPEILRDGKVSEKKKCPTCIEERRLELEREGERKNKKQRRIYMRECSLCGAEVETTQAPRGRVPIYCLNCRKNRKKGERMVTYREAVV